MGEVSDVENISWVPRGMTSLRQANVGNDMTKKVLPINIGVFKYGGSNSNTIKHIYNKSGNLNESYDVAFDSKYWWNLP